MAPAIVEPYNAILATHTSLESVDVCFLVDNQVSGHPISCGQWRKYPAPCGILFRKGTYVSDHVLPIGKRSFLKKLMDI